MTQNVVTYTVVVATDNTDLKLLPYLTANLSFQVDFRHNVLLVSNAALRWKPRAGADRRRRAAEAGALQGRGQRRFAARIPPGRSPPETAHLPGNYIKPHGGSASPTGQRAGLRLGCGEAAANTRRRSQDRGRVWVKDGDFVRPVEVQVGISDGVTTEISGDKISEGMKVVIGEIHKEQHRRHHQSVRAQHVQRRRERPSSALVAAGRNDGRGVPWN